VNIHQVVAENTEFLSVQFCNEAAAGICGRVQSGGTVHPDYCKIGGTYCSPDAGLLGLANGYTCEEDSECTTAWEGRGIRKTPLIFQKPCCSFSRALLRLQCADLDSQKVDEYMEMLQNGNHCATSDCLSFGIDSDDMSQDVTPAPDVTMGQNASVPSSASYRLQAAMLFNLLILLFCVVFVIF